MRFLHLIAWFSSACLCGFIVLAAPASEPQRLTRDGRLMLAPVFINSKEIVFSVHEAPNLVALKRFNVKDGSQTRLHPTVTAHQFDAAFSRDGRYHCYAMSASSPQIVLVIQDLQSKQEWVFRPRDSRAVVRSPSIAPDGKRVVFSLSDGGGQQIASVNMEGKDLKKLTESAGTNTSPACSPDGKQIAFSSSRDGDFDIYVMDAGGGNVRRLTKSPGLDLRPAWSPDGKRIAFTSNRDGNYEIYLMNADGTGQRRLTHHAGKDDYPTWHPDGNRLLFVSQRSGKFDLFLVDVTENKDSPEVKSSEKDLRYLRRTVKNTSMECTFTLSRTGTGWTIRSATGQGKSQLTVTSRYDNSDKLLTAEVVRIGKEGEKKATVTVVEGKARVTAEGKKTWDFDVPAGTIVTSAPDWTDVFALCRRYDQAKGGKQAFAGLWIHPEKEALRLIFTIERTGADPIEHEGKKVKLDRFTIRIRNNSEYTAWADGQGRMIRLRPGPADGKAGYELVLESFDKL